MSLVVVVCITHDVSSHTEHPPIIVVRTTLSMLLEHHLSLVACIVFDLIFFSTGLETGWEERL